MKLKTWTTTEAQARFAELVADARLQPQLVTSNDGYEAVVVSKEYFDKVEREVKLTLLASGFAGPGESDFDRAMKDVRINISKGRGSDAGDP